MLVIHCLLFNGPKSGSIKGAETDQEEGDLTWPYTCVRVSTVRKQNEQCDFKSALWLSLGESSQGKYVHVLPFPPKVASRKYKLPLDKKLLTWEISTQSILFPVYIIIQNPSKYSI